MGFFTVSRQLSPRQAVSPTPYMLTNRWLVVLTEQDTTASASRPLRTSTRSCPALGAPVPYPLAGADGMFVYRTAVATGYTGAVRWSAVLETNLMGQAGSIHGGPERNRRPASGVGLSLAHARGRAGGHRAVGGRDHDPRCAPRYRGVYPQVPTGFSGPESRRGLALAAGGRAVLAALGTEAPTGTVREGHSQTRRLSGRMVVETRCPVRELDTCGLLRRAGR